MRGSQGGVDVRLIPPLFFARALKLAPCSLFNTEQLSQPSPYAARGYTTLNLD